MPTRNIQTTVYPRACGGTQGHAVIVNHAYGLSPRVRGNRGPGGRGHRRGGSIPARAGEPTAATLRCPKARVYPRACGGTGKVSNHTRAKSGLSPRVRGNRRRVAVRWHAGRSIPARAGEPGSPSRSSSGRRVYPRACGGTHDKRDHGRHEQGLSPRVRGNRERHCFRAPANRSIPARAGEPKPPRWSRLNARVYPRACGGTYAMLFGKPVDWGLSPRVRGNPMFRDSHQRRQGSIPARAGEPGFAELVEVPNQVYPRACGGTSW